MALSPLVFAVFNFGGGELMIILLIILILFGGAKLPSLAKGLGQSIKEFKKAARDEDEPTSTNAEAKKSETTSTKS